MPIFTTDIDADGVATITWDLPGRSMNVLDEDGIAELDAAIDATLADDAVKGIVITSAKKDFAGGMDLNVLARMKESAGDDPARGLFEGTMRMHAMLRKLERAGMDSEDPEGRQAGRLGRPRHLRRHRHRDRPRLPPPLHGRQSKGEGRPPRDPCRHLPRRRRHHPRQPDARRDGRRPDPARRPDAGPEGREGRRPDRRGHRPRRAAGDRQGLGAVRHRRRHRQALGRQGLQVSRRRPLQPLGLHDLRRRLRHGPRQDPGRAPRPAGDALGDLRRRAGPVRHRTEDRGALVHPHPDEPLVGGDDTLAVHQQAGAGEGRRPPRRSRPVGAEARRPRRRHDGRGHRLRRGAGRHRGRPDRPRPAGRRQGPRPRRSRSSTPASSAGRPRPRKRPKSSPASPPPPTSPH